MWPVIRDGHPLLLLPLLALVVVSASAASFVPIVTFDGANATTRPWEVVNDPVMGGQSMSHFEVDAARKLGVWNGEVKIVPFLHAPGFCNVQSPGLYKKANFPDLSEASGIVARLRATAGLTKFNVMLMTRGARHLLREGVYVANITLNSEMADHFVPWSAFVCTWRGQFVHWCPDLATQLAQVDSVAFGTAFPGSAGLFHVEIESLAAGEPRQRPSAAAPMAPPQTEAVEMADFGGSAQHHWHSENDPVMGGQSSSSFAVANGFGIYKGSCRIVPKLQAPGFTIAMTETPLMGHFPDVSSMDGLLLGLRNAGGNVTSFKAAFCDSRINYFRCQFQSFKADFDLPSSADFKDVFLPWSAFSDKWSASTGKHTAEEPPTASSLRSVTQLQLWTEGVLGDFEVHVKYIKAVKKSKVVLPLQIIV